MKHSKQVIGKSIHKRYRCVYWARYVNDGMIGTFEDYMRHNWNWCTDREKRLVTSVI